MSSFLWLLLYLAPLLGLTAAVFAWFGWQWRHSDLQRRIEELLGAQIDAAQTALSNAQSAPVTAPAEAIAPPAQNTEELHALRDELASAQAAAHQSQAEAAKAQAQAQTLEAEAARLKRDLAQLQAEHATAQAAYATAQAELASLRSAPPATDAAVSGEADLTAAPAPAKPKRKRSITAKPKVPAAVVTASLREKIAALESQLAKHQASVATLAQERDDWQRRVSKLQEKSPADPAGLGLARRSLTDSEKRLLASTTEIERLQNQTQVLLRVEETTAALSAVPDDDLTQIKGIKKVISEQLRAHGIRTWRQIALWNEEERRTFSELLAFKNRATREQWQEQARALHEAAHGPLA